MFKNLIVNLWNDESGAVIATEYLMLGSIVAAGGASGMVALRDSVTDEYKEFGTSVREVRQAYTPQVKGHGSHAQTAATGPTIMTGVPETTNAQTLNSVCPTP